MIRGDFLRSALLAPLAALVGCRREQPPASEPARNGLVQESPIQATAWTITTTGGTGTTFYVQGQGGTWVPMNYPTYTTR